MRLFTAISLPDDTKEQLHRLMKPLDKVRWLDHTQLHITLKFLGETDPAQLKELIKQLNTVDKPPFGFAINGLGYFPEGDHPRVIWAGIEDESPIVELHRSIEKACRKAGFDREDRPFKPHITLGKAKGASRDVVLPFVKEHNGLYISDVPAEEFILYESRLNSDGAVHEPCAQFPLEGIAPAIT